MQHAKDNAKDFVQEKKAAASAEVHKQQAKDANLPVGDRVSAAGQFVGDKWDETVHAAKRDANATTEDLKHLANEKESAVKASVHKEEAKDPNRPIGDRVSAAGQFVGDKASETYHGVARKM